jgi:hypothetical protein
MQCNPPFTRLIENLEQLHTVAKQLQQCEQSGQQTTQQKEHAEACNVQLVNQLTQLIRNCQQDVIQSTSIFPQMSLLPQAVRMRANLEKIQTLTQQLEQHTGDNHQTTHEKQQYEASTCKLAKQINQLTQNCQQEVNQFISPQTNQPMPYASQMMGPYPHHFPHPQQAFQPTPVSSSMPPFYGIYPHPHM